MTPRRCINQDHAALGIHYIDGAPFGEGCLFPTDLSWAESTHQPADVVAAIAEDDARHREG